MRWARIVALVLALWTTAWGMEAEGDPKINNMKLKMIPKWNIPRMKSVCGDLKGESVFQYPIGSSSFENLDFYRMMPNGGCSGWMTNDEDYYIVQNNNQRLAVLGIQEKSPNTSNVYVVALHKVLEYLRWPLSSAIKQFIETKSKGLVNLYYAPLQALDPKVFGQNQVKKRRRSKSLNQKFGVGLS